MSHFRRKLRLAIKRNLGLKIASLTIALLLWVYVQSTAPPPRFVKFTLQYYALDDSKWAIVGNKPPSVNVRASGPLDDLKRIQDWPANDFTADVNLENPQPGVATYRPRLTLNPARDEHISYSSDLITLNIEPLVTSNPKEVVVQRLDLPDGYTDTEEVNPDLVTLTGAESLVAKVKQVVADVSLSGFKAGAHLIQVPVLLLDSKNNPVQGVTAEPTKVNIHVVLTEAQNLKSVPISLNWKGNLGDYELAATPETVPSQVTVSGNPENLKRIAMVETEPIDLTGLTQDTERTVRLKSLRYGIRTRLKSIRVIIHLVRKPLAVNPPLAPPKQPVGPSNLGP